MVLTVLSIILSILLVVVGVVAFGISGGDLPLLALAIPMLWLIPQGGVATWVLFGGISLFGLTLNEQPLSLSIAVWTLFPLLMVIFSRQKVCIWSRLLLPLLWQWKLELWPYNMRVG